MHIQTSKRGIIPCAEQSRATVQSSYLSRKRLLCSLLLLAFGGAAQAQVACSAKTPMSGPVCDGVTDDTAALNYLIYQASLNGAPAVIPATPNGCRVTAPLQICSNTTVMQRGLLRAKSGWSAAGTPRGMYYIVDGATNVRVEGGGIIDGANLSGTSGITAGSDTLGNYPASGTFNAERVVIHGLTIKNMAQWPIRIAGTDNLRIDGVSARDSYYGVEIGHDTRHATLTGLFVSNIDQQCVKLYRGVSDSTVTNSVIFDCGLPGIQVLTDKPGSYPTAKASANITIDGNIVRESQYGIHVGGAVGSAVATGINISANQTHHNSYLGIGLHPCDNCQITSNMSHHNGNGGSYQQGIFIGNSRQVKVAANTIYNEGQGSTTGRGIVVMDTVPGLNPSARINITGNLIYDDQTPKTMDGAIGGSLPVPIVSTGNSFSSGLPDYFGYASGSVQRNYSTP